MKVSFATDSAFEAFIGWATVDKKLFKKINDLINDIKRTPFTGIGKPEPLKYELQGYWSCRITDEHRLVYKVEADTLIIVSCKQHYKNSLVGWE